MKLRMAKVDRVLTSRPVGPLEAGNETSSLTDVRRSPFGPQGPTVVLEQNGEVGRYTNHQRTVVCSTLRKSSSKPLEKWALSSSKKFARRRRCCR